MAVIVQTEECGVVFSVLFNVNDLELWFHKFFFFFFFFFPFKDRLFGNVLAVIKPTIFYFFSDCIGYVLDVSSCTALAEMEALRNLIWCNLICHTSSFCLTLVPH